MVTDYDYDYVTDGNEWKDLLEFLFATNKRKTS